MSPKSSRETSLSSKLSARRSSSKRTAAGPSLSLAKLTPPSIPKIVERPQLLEQIDQIRNAGAKVVWIQAPPGAGKTTLAATYLRVRKQPMLWYQLNAGDADPAIWFHYLTLGIKQGAPRFRKPMLAFEPAYLPDLTGFTQQFFEELFVRLKSPSLLIFDNYHELPLDSPVQALMGEVIRMIPPRVLCLVTSRQAPPPNFATFIAEQRLVEFPAEALAFNQVETQSLLSLHHPNTQGGQDEWASQLHAQTHGWVAGMILLSSYRPPKQRIGRTTTGRMIPAHVVSDDPILMDYFAQEGLMCLSDEVRMILLKTAMLPAFTASMAQHLTGVVQAGYELRKLARARYFVETRDGGGKVVFQYHPLFRQFLCQQASAELGQATWRGLQARAAELLVEIGWIEEAIQLFLEAHEIHGATQLILSHAPAMIQQSRFQTVGEWLGRLPPETIEAQPYLQYWQGMGQLFRDLPSSLIWFEHAHAQFEQQADGVGQLLAASGAILAIDLTFTQQARMDRWIMVLDKLWEQHGESLPPELQMPIITAMLRGSFSQLPHRRIMLTWLGRAKTLIQRTDSPEFVAQLIPIVVLCGRGYGKLDDVLQTTSSIARRLDSEELSPPNAAMWSITKMWVAALTGASQDAQEHFQRALDIVTRHRLVVLQDILVSVGIMIALSFHDLDTAEAILSQSELPIQRSGQSHLAHSFFCRGWFYTLRGDVDTVLDIVQDSVKFVETSGCRWAEAILLLNAAWIYVVLTRLDEAKSLLSRVTNLAEKIEHVTLTYSCRTLYASIALQSETDAVAMDSIQQAFSLGREYGIFHSLEPWYPQIMTPLCVKALEESIESEYTRQLIQAKRLLLDARTAVTTAWPWPIRIQTLSTFQITIETGLLRFSRKTPLTPLRLLKLLISLGGQEISLTRLSDVLWPDAEGDAAYRSVLTTLMRLRKLLGHEDVLLVQGGLLSLNTQLCWVDCFAVEYLMTMCDTAIKICEKAKAREYGMRARELYRGPFLPADEEIPEIWRMRERLELRLVRLDSYLSNEQV